MKRYILFFIALHFSLPGLAQHQAKQWVFGQGLGMDFTTPQVSYFSTPWTAVMNNNNDLNQSSVYCGKDGKLIIYFLNGKYYDKDFTLISGGEVHNYMLSTHLVYNNSKPSFFIDVDENTLLHYYVFGEFYPPRWTNNLKIRLNKIKLLNNTVISIDSVDTYAPNSPISNLYNFQRPININPIPILDKNIILLPKEDITHFATLVSIDTTGFNIINNHNLTTQQFLPNFHMAPDLFHFYHPLNQNIYTFGNHFQLNQLPHTFIVKTKHINSFNFENIFQSPKYTIFPNKYNLRLENLKISTTIQGRYVYIFGNQTNEPNQPLKILRGDLFSKDSIEFYNSILEIPLPQYIPGIWLFEHKYFLDAQSAPDGNIYFSIFTQSPSSSFNNTNNDPSNKYLHRIVNPEDKDSNNIQVQMNIHTFPDWSLFASFPGLSTNQLMPPPFEVLSACSDSVHLDLNYKNIIDSVWWDFGDPVGLGAANNSSVVSPVIKYPNYGKYYVSVQLWFDGDTLRTLGDTVLVEPVPHVEFPFHDTLICIGESVTMDASQGFEASYLWSTGSTDSVLEITETGLYWVQVSTACGTAYDTVQVRVIRAPEEAVHDTSVCFFGPVLFDVSADSATYLWSTGSTEPTFAPRQIGNYWVEVQNICGGYYKEFRVELENCEKTLYIPNAFTPNGDGVNDCFQVSAENVADYYIQIFNRWGTMVYSSTDPKECWDGQYQGKPVQEGVYLYLIR
ncbi:gliding motility-associated C-terminal domain-containing protein [Schleiferia thermophila]|uniref:gliding motility-associated C-terminal domain-containing protein n=1 Tax=Schleiferia thermophila TaxID=884107 RepID=UPI000568C2EC|nr:T9SS C-terminal target domain-containing protein [Schleiferia thermophila]